MKTTLWTIALARPPRAAVFFDSTIERVIANESNSGSTPNWTHFVLRVLEATTEAWGGFGFVLVPFDGTTMPPGFAELVGIYDPDYLPVYRFSATDIEMSHAEWGRDRRKQITAELSLQGFGEATARRYLAEETRATFRVPWAPDDAPGRFYPQAFVRQLLRICSPFHRSTEDSLHLDPESFSIYNDRLYPFIAAGEIVRANKLSPNIVDYRHGESDWQCELAAAAVLGRTNPLQRERLSTLGVTVREETVGLLELSQQIKQSLADPALRNVPHTPSSMSAYSLRGYSLPFRDGTTLAPWQRITIVMGESAADFCLYHGLSRATFRCLWLPKNPTEPYLHLLQLVWGNILSRLPSTECHVLSSSMSGVDCRQTLEALLDQAPTLRDFCGNEPVQYLGARVPTPSTRNRLSVDQPTIEAMLQFEDGIATSSISSPVPACLQPLSNLQCTWINEFVHRNYLPANRSGFANALRDNRAPEAFAGEHHARWGYDGECRRVPHDLLRHQGDVREEARPALLVRPEDELLFASLLRFSGRRITLSDKGRYQRELIAAFGGLPNAAEWLRRADFQKLLRDVFRKRDESSTACVYISGDSRCVIGWPIMHAIFGDKAKDTLSHFLERHVFSRGSVLKCGRCGRVAWYSPHLLGAEFLCEHCNTTQLLVPDRAVSWVDSGEPAWHYRLNEMIAQAVTHSGHVTVLALDAIRRSHSSQSAFHYVGEVDVIHDGQHLGEIDLLAMSAGRLVVGECKQAGPAGEASSINNKQLRGYSAVAAALKPTQVLFATDGQRWSDGDRGRILRVFPGAACWTSTQLTDLRDLDLGSLPLSLN